jgi:hypothetical protein
MRVIFLDIDGVLNCKRTPNPRKFPYIVDQKLLERFRGLVARADAGWSCIIECVDFKFAAVARP